MLNLDLVYCKMNEMQIYLLSLNQNVETTALGLDLYPFSPLNGGREEVVDLRKFKKSYLSAYG